MGWREAPRAEPGLPGEDVVRLVDSRGGARSSSGGCPVPDWCGVRRLSVLRGGARGGGASGLLALPGVGDEVVRLFHFTGEQNWHAIALDRAIITLLQKNERYGHNPRLRAMDERLRAKHPEVAQWDDLIDGVVWLTTNAAPRQQWMAGAFTQDWRDKGRIRIEVDAPDALSWPMYANRVRFPKNYRESLNVTGGGQERMWYLTERAIPEAEWLQVVRFEEAGSKPLVLWEPVTSVAPR